MKSTSKTGFTLLEVLVAAVIIMVITAVGVASYVSVTKKSRDARRKSDLEQVRQALEMYKSDNGYYPDANTGNYDAISNLELKQALVPNYLPKLPSDPQGDTLHAYQYHAILPDGGGSKYYGYCLAAQTEVEIDTSVVESGVCPSLEDYNYVLSQP